jgi:hypothetical protein
MTKPLFVLIFIMLLLAFGTGNALAEDSLTTILNQKFGAGNFHQIANASGYEFSPKTYDVTVILSDKQSGFNYPTGWYATSNPNSKISIFENPSAEIGRPETIDPNVNFGLYINSRTGTFYSNSNLNPDDLNHVKVFQIDNGPEAGAYVLGYEDQINSSDWDYQDIVIELKRKSLSIPDFPTIALPVAAFFGLVFMFRHKKENM